MAQRTRRQEIEQPSESGSSTTFTLNAGNITAGDGVRFGFRYEGGTAVTVTAVDSEGRNYRVTQKTSPDSPTVAVLDTYNHPGGTGVTITVTLAAARSYREGWGEVVSGQVGELDWLTGDYATNPTANQDDDASSGPMSCTVEGVTGDCDLFMICGSYSGSNNYDGASGSSRIPSTIGAYTLYAAAFKQHFTGTGNKTITHVGGNGATRAIALAFLDDAGTGSTGSTVTAAAGAATVSAASASTAATTATAAAGAATVSGVGGTLVVLVSSVFKNNTGTALASLTDVTVWVNAVESGALVVKKSGQATNGSGVLTVNDAAIVTATQYRVTYRNEATGAWGSELVTAT